MKYSWIDTELLQKPGVTKDLQAEWNWIRYHIGGKCLQPSVWMMPRESRCILLASWTPPRAIFCADSMKISFRATI